MRTIKLGKQGKKKSLSKGKSDLGPYPSKINLEVSKGTTLVKTIITKRYQHRVEQKMWYLQITNWVN